MKRRAILIILIVTFSLFLVSASAGGNTDVNDDAQELKAAEVSQTDSESLTDSSGSMAPYSISDGLSAEGYMLRDTDDPSKLIFYAAVTNNSNSTLNISVSADALDADGGTHDDTQYDSVRHLGSGETSMVRMTFKDAVDCSNVKYTVKSSTLSAYDSKRAVIRNINITIDEKDGKIVVTAVNKGKRIADLFKVYLLFFDENGALIDVSENYLRDDEDELKPGETLSKEIEINVDYKSIKVFSNGSPSDKASSDILELLFFILMFVCAFAGPTFLSKNIYRQKIRKSIKTWVTVHAEITCLDITDKSFKVRGHTNYRFLNKITAKYRMPDGSEHERIFEVMTQNDRTSPYADAVSVEVTVDPEHPEIGVLSKSLERNKITNIKGTAGLIVGIIAAVIAAAAPILICLYMDSSRFLLLYLIYPVSLAVIWFCSFRNDTEELRSMFK